MKLKTLLPASILLLPLLAASAHAAEKSPLAGQRVLWLGDSITQAGSYVTFVEYYLNRDFPDQSFDIISIGLGSETLSGLSEKHHPFPRPCLHERLTRAIQAVKPTTIIACYGMNDGIYHPQSPERLAAFEAGLRKLIDAAHAASAKLILITPPVFEAQPVHAKTLPPGQPDPDYSYMKPFEAYDSVLADYARLEMALPPSDAQVIDLHTRMTQYQESQRKTDPTFAFTRDGIHPGPDGHLLMAHSILQALATPITAPDLKSELAKIQADPLYKLIAKHRETRSRAWLDFVGYTRGKTTKTDSPNPAEQTAATLQSQINTLRTQKP